MPLAMDVPALERFFASECPQLGVNGETFSIDAVGPMTATLRFRVSDRHLRPGGTVSGPTMMALADLALYAAILASIGPVALAVTTNLAFNFLRKPPPADLLAHARLLKLGRRLAVGEVSIVGIGAEDVLCHATGTYSIPPQ